MKGVEVVEIRDAIAIGEAVDRREGNLTDPPLHRLPIAREGVKGTPDEIEMCLDRRTFGEGGRRAALLVRNLLKPLDLRAPRQLPAQGLD